MTFEFLRPSLARMDAIQYQPRPDKPCAHCKAVKPLDEFYDRPGRSTKMSWCKACQNTERTRRRREGKK